MCKDQSILKIENIWLLIAICQNVAFPRDCIITEIFVFIQ